MSMDGLIWLEGNCKNGLADLADMECADTGRYLQFYGFRGMGSKNSAWQNGSSCQNYNLVNAPMASQSTARSLLTKS
jgi:hypothetical protein